MLGLLHPLLLSDVVLFVFSSSRISHVEEDDDEAFFVSPSAHYCWVNKCNCSVPAFSRPLSRCFPLVDRPPLLCLWCADGTSSTQRTSSILSLHMQILHREDAKERGRRICITPCTREELLEERASQRWRELQGSMPHLGGRFSLWRTIRLLASLHRHTEQHKRSGPRKESAALLHSYKEESLLL